MNNQLDKNDIIEFLIEQVSATVGMTPSQLTSEMNLESIGLSSLNAVLISGELEDKLQIEIDPMIMFESKTIDEVADKVLQLNA